MTLGVASGKNKLTPLMFHQLPLAQLNIIEVMGVQVNSKVGLFHIYFINDKLLQFVSELNFPVNQKMALQIRVHLMTETIELQGYIDACKHVDTHFLYDVLLTIRTTQRMNLLYLLNQLARKYQPEHQKIEEYCQYFSENSPLQTQMVDFKN